MCRRVEGAKNSAGVLHRPVSEGMIVHTNTQRVRNARKVLYELLLSDHRKDCLSCSRNEAANCSFGGIARGERRPIRRRAAGGFL